MISTSQSQTGQSVGVDICKRYLDAAGTREKAFRVANDTSGRQTMVERLKALDVSCVVLEATGGLERPAALALAEAGLPVRVVDPARVRHFARSLGRRAKTDRLDAGLLARYAEAARPEARDLPDEAARDLRALLERRRQLVAMRVAEENRLGQATAAVRAGLEAHVAYLRDQVERVDAAAGELIAAREEWRTRDAILRT